MRPAVKTAMLAAAALALLSGCAGHAPADESAITDWQARQHAASSTDEDLVGVLYGRVDAGKAPIEDVDGGVSMTFAEPTGVRGVEVSCFGRGSVSGFLFVDSGSTSRSRGVDVRCGDVSRTITLPHSWGSGVERVGFNATEASDETAWQVLIR